MFFYRPFDISLSGLFRFSRALVVKFFTSRETDLYLDQPLFEIRLCRNKGKTFLLHFSAQTVYFVTAQKEFSRSRRFGLELTSLFVRRDMTVDKPHFPVADDAERVLKIYLPQAHGFDLAARKNYARLVSFIYEIFVIRLFIGGDYFNAFHDLRFTDLYLFYPNARAITTLLLS